jgi:hypothetical protein
MGLTITNCFATPTSVVVYFSEPLDPAKNKNTNPNSIGNYTVLPQLQGAQPKALPLATATYNVNDNASTLALTQPLPTDVGVGTWLAVTGNGVAPAGGTPGTDTFFVRISAAAKLKIKSCLATPNSVVAYFSEALDTANLGKGQGTNDPNLPANYTVVLQPPGGPPTPVNLNAATYDPLDKATILRFQAIQTRGSWLSVAGTGPTIGSGVGPGSGGPAGTDPFFVRVNGDKGDENAKRATQAAEDAVAYPVMTEEVGTPPSSSYINGGGGSVITGGGGGMQIGQTANQAIADVLGWKINDNDPKGFVGALTQSFALTETEGHVDATWTPRTYAVQTDLSGGITGAQASIYTRAQDALQQSLPLLQGLYALNPDSDPELANALKDIVSSQFTELVNELGYAGGPRISRVNQYFNLLLGGPPFPVKSDPAFTIISDPDKIKGTLGRLRKELQLQSFSHYVNTVEDEQDVTNFRILSDYVTSLAQSWVNNVGFFGLDTKEAFLGTQLVLLSRQLSVIGETVGEVRFTLDSVFIGSSERQTLQLEFRHDPAMFIEDLLSWAEAFAKNEGPDLIQNAGKLGLGDGFVPVVNKLSDLVEEARHPLNERKLPPGYNTIRVQRSLKDLHDQLLELARLAKSVSLKNPPKVFDFDEIMAEIKREVAALANRNKLVNP